MNLALKGLRLEHDSVLAIEWFEYNYMKVNQDRCHLLISGHKYESMWANNGSRKIWESIDEKRLGFNIDRNLKFSYYILKPCKKGSRKLIKPAIICKFMSLERWRVLMKYFIESRLHTVP